MTHEKAEIMLKQLSLCMNNLEIVAYKPQPAVQPSMRKQIV